MIELPINGYKKRTRAKMDLSTLVYGKVPPQARDLEEAILGAIMLERDAFVVASQFLFADSFYVDGHQRIFAAMLKLYDAGKPIDILTVVQQLRAVDELDIIGGAYYVTKLTNNVTGSAHIEAHCKIVLENYMKREAIRIGGDFIQEAYEDSSDPFELYNKADNDIINTQEKVLKGQMTDVSGYAMQVAEQHATVKVTGVLGISTGLMSLNRVICGLVAPDLIIVAARPGQGKTSFALSITHNTSVKNKIPCAWFSLEMDGVQLVRRLASLDSNVNHEVIRNGKTSTHEEALLNESLERIANCPIYIEDDANLNIRDIRTRAYILKRKYKIEYIVVDYIQLMGGVETKGKSREQIISEISRGLKCLAKELSIPVIGLSQLSRAVESRADKMPQLSDLRESGAIEQDADEVIFLMRPEYYGMMNEVEIGGTSYGVSGLAIGLIQKNRHGETKNIPLSFYGNTMKFSDYGDNTWTPPPIQIRNRYEVEQKEPDEDIPF